VFVNGFIHQGTNGHEKEIMQGKQVFTVTTFFNSHFKSK